MDKVFIVWWEEKGWEPDSGITEVCATEEIALAVKKNWEKENPEHDVWIEPWDIETEMPKVFKNINDIKFGKEKFKLKGSDHIFIAAEISCQAYGFALVDLTDGVVYEVEEVVDEKLFNFDFYYKEDDEEYWGVEVIEENE